MQFIRKAMKPQGHSLIRYTEEVFGGIHPSTCERPVLRVDIDPLSIPYYQFIPGITGNVMRHPGKVRVTIIGEHHDPSSPSVHQATFHGVR